MKKKICLLSILIISLLSCCEIAIPKEEELERYPWIKTFTSGYTNFKGIKHNLDTGEYSFAFKNGYNNSETFFSITDSLALKEGWEVIECQSTYRKYKRKSDAYSDAKHYDLVTLLLNIDEQWMIFETERLYKE